jgi:hypothetical protein
MSLFGVYRGYVEYINDPEQRGRVRVRIPNLTGYPSDVDTVGLPWAETANSFGGGHDYGSKAIPPVGSTCFVMFEGGNPELPVVIGTWDSNPNKSSLMLRDVTGKYPAGEVSMSPSPTQPWEATEGPDAPKEYLQQVDNRPERYVPFKSVKGAVFDIEDRDEVEHTRILDRTGQGLFISGPVKAIKEGLLEPANLNNEAQRGLKNSLDGTALPIESTVTNEGTVSLIDIGSQSISLISKKDANKIQIISKQGVLKDTLTESGNKETAGKANVTMELNSGNKTFTLDVQDNGISKAKITINGDTGIIEIESPSLVRIKADRTFLDGNVDISGNLTVNKTITCNEDGLFAGIVLSN